jgi:hypothetical protein
MAVIGAVLGARSSPGIFARPYPQRTIPMSNYYRALLAIAELIKAIVEDMSEQEVELSNEHQFTTEASAADL